MTSDQLTQHIIASSRYNLLIITSTILLQTMTLGSEKRLQNIFFCLCLCFPGLFLSLLSFSSNCCSCDNDAHYKLCYVTSKCENLLSKYSFDFRILPVENIILTLYFVSHTASSTFVLIFNMDFKSYSIYNYKRFWILKKNCLR